MASFRHGWDSTREISYIRQRAVGIMPHNDVPRCETCGRAELCCCPDCDCTISKERGILVPRGVHH